MPETPKSNPEAKPESKNSNEKVRGNISKVVSFTRKSISKVYGGIKNNLDTSLLFGLGLMATGNLAIPIITTAAYYKYTRKKTDKSSSDHHDK